MILTHVDLIEKLLKYVPAAERNELMRRQNAEMQRHQR
jgi:hypothetical protein